MSIPAIFSCSVRSIAERNLVATACRASSGHNSGERNREIISIEMFERQPFSLDPAFVGLSVSSRADNREVCWYLKPVDGTTIHQRWKFSNPIAKIVTYRRHHYHYVQLFPRYSNEQIEERHRASIGLHGSISLSVYLLHLLAYLGHFFAGEYVWYLKESVLFSVVEDSTTEEVTSPELSILLISSRKLSSLI